MFERFAASARRALAFAGTRSLAERTAEIEVRHLLGGVFDVAAIDAKTTAVDAQTLVTALYTPDPNEAATPKSILNGSLIPYGGERRDPPNTFRFTADANRALARASDIATEVGQDAIGAEHLLAAVLMEPSLLLDVQSQPHINADDVLNELRRRESRAVGPPWPQCGASP